MFDVDKTCYNKELKECDLSDLCSLVVSVLDSPAVDPRSKRWVPCGDMDRRLKIPHSAKAECGFRTTPEECLYDSGSIISIGPHNIIQYNSFNEVIWLSLQ